MKHTNIIIKNQQSKTIRRTFGSKDTDRQLLMVALEIIHRYNDDSLVKILDNKSYRQKQYAITNKLIKKMEELV